MWPTYGQHNTTINYTWNPMGLLPFSYNVTVWFLKSFSSQVVMNVVTVNGLFCNEPPGWQQLCEASITGAQTH